ncbi:MAG: hypothetical protein R3C18_24375 [Planctomycetaceae bacterium]
MVSQRRVVWKLWVSSYALSLGLHAALYSVTLVILMVAAPSLLTPRRSQSEQLSSAVVESQWQLRREVTVNELEQAAASEPVAASSNVDSNAPSVSPFIKRELERKRQEAESQTPEEMVADLKKLGSQLESVASPESVDQTTSVLQATLGVKPAAVPDESADPAEFDPDSAQLFDVSRAENDAGEFVYTAILVDRNGVQSELELTAEEGEQLYKTFQLMKQFPLLEKVYRNVAAGLIDQILEQDSTNEKPAAEIKPSPPPVP